MTNPDNRILSNYATFSQKTKGRMIFENHIDERTCFQRDRDRILHSAAFRRLKHKTQVFLNEQGDYYRTRLTHTIEVSQISRSISFALNLNEDLTEAIALSHDLGHPPFGHAGEEILNKKLISYGGFEDNEQAVEIANSTNYGLASGVFTSDDQKAKWTAERINAGIIWQNDWFVDGVNLPGGGYKRSGYGRDGGIDGIYSHGQTKRISKRLK